MQVKILKHHPEAIIPEYATSGSSGLDLHARIPHDIYLQPGARFTCPTGIGIELPEGFEAQIRGRSGLAQKHGIGIVHGIGTVDADYRGEIKALLINHGDEPVKIEPGQRIAQMVIAPRSCARNWSSPNTWARRSEAKAASVIPGVTDMGHTKEPWHYRVGKDGHEVWASLDEKSRMHVATCGWGESFAQANTRRLELIYLLANIWDSEFMNDPEWEDIDEPRINALVARAKGSAP